ncbi:hypothetical protein BC828DRAFT_390487 [Blastocladiella britannica]|nr:hypothetical protein BC828DRAFT_390487 [Blastocladiella britannica]
MHVIVGTEGGQIKSVPYGAGTSSTVALQQALVPIQPGARAAAEAAAKAANSQVTTFGVPDKSSTITLMTSARLHGREVVLFARKNGVVEVWDHAATGNPDLNPLLVSVPVFTRPTEGKSDFRENSVLIVGVGALDESTIFAVNRLGSLHAVKLAFHPAQDETETDVMEVESTTEITLGLSPLDRVRACTPTHPHLLALGGQNRDLVLVDLNKPATEAAPKGKQSESKYAGLGREPTAWNGELNPTPVWYARNLAHDMLDMAVPVWITDLCFTNPEGSTVVTCTMYHDVKLYHTQTQRRPLAVVYCGEHPMRSITPVPGRPTEVVVADARGAVTHLSMTRAAIEYARAEASKDDPGNPRTRRPAARQGKSTVTAAAVLGGFQGAQGAVRSIACDGKSVVAVGLDRFVRFWDLKTHQARVRFFVKQRCESLALWQSPIGPSSSTATAAGAVVGEAVGDDDVEEVDHFLLAGHDETEELGLDAGRDVWKDLEELAERQETETLIEEEEPVASAPPKSKATKRKAGAVSKDQEEDGKSTAAAAAPSSKPAAKRRKVAKKAI